MDITARSDPDFLYQASHTSKKYLPETMGGVALFACDNDGLLDIFPVNGAGFFLAMCPRFHGPAEGNHSAGRERVGCISALPGDAETYGRRDGIQYEKD